MRLRQLHLSAFGPFTGKVLDFSQDGHNLFLVHGPNEAGKSSTLRAICDLRYGIPQQSGDNFRHAHPDMCVGGVFVDAGGRTHSLMRRKRRENALTFHDFGRGGAPDGAPVSPDIEALLTGGMSREEYLSMFGIDHQRLREGGRALVRGDGEVGAALFEASAGIRSMPALLQRLDEQAKQFYSRSRSSRINVALGQYTQQHDALRKAVVKPAAWADLSRQQAAAREELDRLNGELEARRGRRLLFTELRAVAPLLAAIDAATATLGGLADAPVLPADAGGQRVAIETKLGEAAAGERATRVRIEALKAQLAGLTLDDVALGLGAAIERLAASQEQIDATARDLRDAVGAEQSALATLAAAARAIDAGASVDALVRLAPPPAHRADIVAALERVEQAREKLGQLLEALGELDGQARAPETDPLPPDELRFALSAAMQEATRIASTSARLALLPSEIAAARRTAASALAAIDRDEAALERVRPMLDNDIDAAVEAVHARANATRGLRERIGQIEAAIAQETQELFELNAQGAVPTPAQVEAARAHRNHGWSLVRQVHVERHGDGAAEATVFAGGKDLADAYEAAVRDADRLVDELSRDAQRAARLQQLQQHLAALHGDRGHLAAQVDELEAQAAQERARWARRLAEAGLPDIEPASLRQWQTRFAAASAALEILHQKEDEFEHARSVEAQVGRALRQALLATGWVTVAADAPLRTLGAMADEVAARIKRREQQIAAAAVAAQLHKAQRERLLQREAGLREALRDATAALAPALSRLMLAPTAGTEVARARLGEFEGLLAAHDRHTQAQRTVEKHEATLAAHRQQAGSIAAALGEPAPQDLRLFIDRVADRLKKAKAQKERRAMVESSLREAETRHQDYASGLARQRDLLRTLCQAAGVDDAAHLPQAEERSARKRAAQERLEEARLQVARASARPADELERLLKDHAAADRDAFEAECARILPELEAQAKAARGQEEAARRALEAVDSGDAAAAAREAMEQAAAGVRTHMASWIRARLAHALLEEATRRYRERAQGPMLKAASTHFRTMTADEFVGLVSDDAGSAPVLLAQRRDGAKVRVEAMSEGTQDQLYLALRLAALELRRATGVDMPVILDDVLMTSDDGRAAQVVRGLKNFSAGSQVLVFTHHRHLVDVAQRALDGALAVVYL